MLQVRSDLKNAKYSRIPSVEDTRRVEVLEICIPEPTKTKSNQDPMLYTFAVSGYSSYIMYTSCVVIAVAAW